MPFIKYDDGDQGNNEYEKRLALSKTDALLPLHPQVSPPFDATRGDS